MNLEELIVGLLAAHYVADFAMQNQYVADAKAKVHTSPDGIHALTAHAFHHLAAAGLVLVLLGIPWLIPALIVGASHWLIDYGKAVRGWYGYHVDQLAHLAVAVTLAIVLAVIS